MYNLLIPCEPVEVNIVMGSSESKMDPPASIKPKSAVKNTRISHVIDPRSPSTGIDRTPIQVGYLTTTVWRRVKHILTSNPFTSNFKGQWV